VHLASNRKSEHRVLQAEPSRDPANRTQLRDTASCVQQLNVSVQSPNPRAVGLSMCCTPPSNEPLTCPR
jgi:hypothetical protein